MLLFQLRIEHDETFGDYTCVAENKLGRLQRVVTLSEGAKPGLPHIRVVSIDPGTVKVEIQVRSNIRLPAASFDFSAILYVQENKSELFLEIVGFRVEVKEKWQLWQNATVIDFQRSKLRCGPGL